MPYFSFWMFFSILSRVSESAFEFADLKVSKLNSSKNIFSKFSTISALSNSYFLKAFKVVDNYALSSFLLLDLVYDAVALARY